MPHPLTTDFAQLGDKLIGITNRRQLAPIAAEIQQLALRLDAALAQGDERIPVLEDRLLDLEQRFDFHRRDGQVLIAGTAQPDIAEKTVDLRIPACAGITEVPFTVANAKALVLDGDLHIHLEIEHS